MIYKGKGGIEYNLSNNPFAQGGEGKIYTIVGKPKLVAKLYKNNLNTTDKERKLIIMVDNPPIKEVMNQISWPVDVLYDSRNAFVGFVMHKLDINEDLNVIYEYGESAKYPNTPWNNKIIMAKNLCVVLNAVHEAGHVVGDLNPKNISVNPSTGHVIFVDTDSYHIEDNGTTYRCNVGMPEYLPVEIQKKMKGGLSSCPLPTFSEHTDNFALAVHIFQLLMNSCHPFSCRVLPSQASVAFPQPTDNILNGVFPFMQPKAGTAIPIFAPTIDILPKEMQELFKRAFIDGYTNPSRRPDPVEWYTALTNLEKELVSCKKVEHHKYIKGLSKCPWCEVNERFTSGLKNPNKIKLVQSTIQQGAAISISNAPTAQTTIQPTKNKKSKKKLIVTLVTIFCVALLAVGGFGINKYNENKKVENVYNLIYALPEESVIDYDAYEDEILAAMSNYNNLSAKLKDKVENKDKLLSLMESYNEFKVDNVRDKANQISVDTVATSNVLNDFATLYSALTYDQKELLSSDEISKFDNLSKVHEVVENLNYIDENVGERYHNLSNTKSIYNSIDTDYLELVYNAELIDSLELKYELREYIEIDSANELKALANQNGKYQLVRDIDLSGESNWQPIDNFSGVLYGNGYSIKNLTINAVNKEDVGLFSYLKGTVSNLKVTNANVTVQGDKNHVAILAGSCSGTVDNVQVSGSVVATYANYVGGIVGDMNQGGKINNCINYASVTGKQHVGGIFGEIDANIDGAVNDNVNEGFVSGDENVGGIGGYLQNTAWRYSSTTHTISNNTNNGEIKGKAKVGGIFGRVYGAHHDDSYGSSYDGYGYFEMTLLKNNGKITCSGNDVGGLIGYGTRVNKITLSENQADITGNAAVGGFVGYSPSTYINASGFINVSTITGGNRIGAFAGEAGVIENAINSGSIVFVSSTATEARIGGIAGDCNGLINCVNNSDITVENGLNYVGGLAGYITTHDTNKVNDNVNNGKVTAETSENVGGIAGYLQNTAWRYSSSTHVVSNNINNKAVKGKSNVGGIFGRVYGAHHDDSYGSSYDGYGYFEVVNSTNNAEIFGENYVGGIVGYYTRLKTEANYMNTNKTLYGEKLGH